VETGTNFRLEGAIPGSFLAVLSILKITIFVGHGARGVGCYCRREECNRQRSPSAGSCILAGGAGGESQSENQASPYPYLSGTTMSLWFVYFKIEYVGHLPEDAYFRVLLVYDFPRSRRPMTPLS